MKFKDVLCNQRLNLKHRLRLFDSVVTPSVLYGCECWTLTSDARRRLKTDRQRMLRWMAGIRRREGEAWVEYIQRATHWCEDQACNQASFEWAYLACKRKWKFAGLTARRDDNRRSCRLLGWTPWFRLFPYRRVGRPTGRWDDEIARYAGGTCRETALDARHWHILGEGFAQGLA